MKRITLLSCFVCASLFMQAQTDFELVAQRGSRNRFYRPGTAVKITYQDASAINEFRGRIAAITADSIFLRRFQRQDYSLALAVNQLESVRKVRRTGRAVMGFIAGIAAIHGIALIVDDNKDHSDWLDGLEAGLGVSLMLLGGACYIVTAATEPVSKTSKGYQFMIVQKK